MSDFENKIKNSSPEEAKNLVIDSLVPECRDVGRNFFNCVETSLMGLTSKANTDYAEIEKKMINEFVPKCMTKHDLESCLQKFEKN
jgi:hypothetical protein